jgi:hypothetical protein
MNKRTIFLWFFVGMSTGWTIGSLIVGNHNFAFLGLTLWALSLVHLFYGIGNLLINIKRRIWNKRIRVWWCRLWIRENEFHKTLNVDIEAVLVMNDKEKENYMFDLMRRRELAHSGELLRSSQRLGIDTFGD